MRNKIIDIVAGKFILEKTNTKTVRFVLFVFFSSNYHDLLVPQC